MLRSFLNLIYPTLCASCGKALHRNEKAICVNCLGDIPRTEYYMDKDNVVAKLFWGKVKLEFGLSSFVFVKKGKIQKLMHELKYRGNTEVGEVLGIELGKEIKKLEGVTQVDFVVPVPLHPKKLKLRGYNQSDFIANGVAKVLGCEVGSDILLRNHFTESQTKKSKYERWENVGSVFQINRKDEIKNKHILIVDDVVTTGSTIEACCIALKEIEGVKLSVATLASA